MLYEYSDGEIYIRHAIDDAPNDAEFEMHIHEQCEIYYFVSGHVEYLVEGSRYLLEPGSLLIMRPSEAHRARILSSQRYERYAINFPVSFFLQHDPQGHLTKAFVNRPLGSGNLFHRHQLEEGFLLKILKELCLKENDYEKRLTFATHLPMLLDIIARVFHQRRHEPVPAPSLSEQMIAYVNSQLCNPISIPELAQHFYLSASQFSRIFKAATGAAPWEYITRKRLILANEKMLDGLSAKDTCEQCGFLDYSSFYRAYKKFWGRTPKGH